MLRRHAVRVVGVLGVGGERGLVGLRVRETGDGRREVSSRRLERGDAVGGGDGEGVGDDRRVRKYVDGVGVNAAAVRIDSCLNIVFIYKTIT